jgi:hypothetical protein
MLNVNFEKHPKQKALALFEVLLRFFTDHYDPKNLLFYMYVYSGVDRNTGVGEVAYTQQAIACCVRLDPCTVI